MTWTGNPGVHSLISQARVIDTTIVEDFAAANPGTLPANQGVVTDGDHFIADDEATVTTLIVKNNRVTGSAVTDSAAIVKDEAAVAVRGAAGATVLATATAEVAGAALSGVRLASTQAVVPTGTTYETDTGKITVTVEDNTATAAFELDAEYGLVIDGDHFIADDGVTVTTLIVANGQVTGSAVTESAAVVTDEAAVAIRGAAGEAVLATAAADVAEAALSGVRLTSTQAVVPTGATYETDTGTVTLTVEDNVVTAAFELDAGYGLVADAEVFQVEGGTVTASIGEEGAITFTFTPDGE